MSRGLTRGPQHAPVHGIKHGGDALWGGGAAPPSTTTLTIALADSTDSVTGGSNFDYTAVVTNTGSAEATTVTALVTLDASLTYVSGSGTGWSVGHSLGVVTCTRAAIAVGVAPTITITVTSANTSATITTLGDVDASNSDPAAQDSETTTIVGQTTLAISINDSADPVDGGSNFDYSVIVTNSGANTATTVEASIVLDSSLTYVSSSGTGWTTGHSAGIVTCTRASLAVGAAPTITITVTSTNASSTETTTADVDATNTPPATQDSETTVVVGQTTLTVSIVDSADPVITAVNFNYTVQVTNTGAIAATSITTIITLDTSLTYVSSSGTGWSISQSAGVVTCTLASLAVGAANPITVTVTTAGSGSTVSTSATTDGTNTALASNSQTTVVNLVTKDATSGKRVPASNTEWTNFLAYYSIATGNPSSLFLCQEASGNLADSIGAITLTAAGTPSYSNAITGWTRVGVGTADGTAGQRFRSTQAGLPDCSTTSVLLLGIIQSTATPGNVRGVMDIGTTQANCRITTTPNYRSVAGTTVTGTSNCGTSVRPVVMKMDTTADKTAIYTDQEKITQSSITTPTGKLIGIGADSGTSASPSRYLYLAMFSGSAAELSDAQVKTLLQSLGWTIPWS